MTIEEELEAQQGPIGEASFDEREGEERDRRIEVVIVIVVEVVEGSGEP